MAWIYLTINVLFFVGIANKWWILCVPFAIFHLLLLLAPFFDRGGGDDNDLGQGYPF